MMNTRRDEIQVWGLRFMVEGGGEGLGCRVSRSRVEGSGEGEVRMLCAPAPCTLHPAPCTLHPAPGPSERG